MENQLNLAVQQDARLTQSELIAESSRTSLVNDFFRSMAYSGVQAPVDGVTQIIDKATGSNLQQTLHKIDAPQQAEFLSARWAVQQTGSAVGVLPWFVALHKGTSAVLGRTALVPNAVRLAEAGEALTVRQAMSVNGFRALESGIAGTIYGGFLTPSKPGEDLLNSRLRHATSSALTFSTLSLAAGSMRLGGEMLATRNPLTSAVLKNEAAAGLLSGIPAGFVAANSESLLAGKGMASLEENAKSMTTFSLLGMGFGAINSRFQEQPTVKMPEAKPLAENLPPLAERSTTSALLTGPEIRLNVAQAKPEVTGTATAGRQTVVTTDAAVARPTTSALNRPEVRLDLAQAKPELLGSPTGRVTEVARTTGGGGEPTAAGAADAVVVTSRPPANPENVGGRSNNIEPVRPTDTKAQPVNRGEVKTTLGDGTLVIEKPNGITVTKRPNGDTTIKQADGSAILNQADGWVIRFDKTGAEIDRVRPKGRTPLAEREFNVASMNVDPLAKAMSNLNQRPFVLDGVKFESVEGFYRWLQWSQDPVRAAQMPGLHGSPARAAGKGCQFTHATFRGESFELGSPKHHEVIKLAIRESLRQNPELAQQFATTHPRPIIHNTGRRESPNTKLPGVVFSRILTEVRQEIVEGKLLDPRPAGQDAPMAKPLETTSLSDAVAAINNPEIAQFHPVSTYAAALRGVDMPVRSLLGGGRDSISLELATGDVVKLTTNYIAPDLGTRPFDAPILSRGSVSLDGGFVLNWFTQAKGQTPVPTAMVRSFSTGLPPEYMFVDRKPTNLALFGNDLKLIDYWAVRRTQ